MGWPVCNTTLTDQKIKEDPIAHGLTFHQLGLIISVLSTLFATILSVVLIILHATHYAQPGEQKHIIRILFMIPIHSVVSFLSFLYYPHAVYFQVVRDCYEAIAIASFFTLLCYYIAPNLHDQKDFFRGLPLRDWVIPISWFRKCCGGERGIWRKPRSGLTWFNIVWLGVYQYCFVRVFFTFVSLVTQAAGVYCEESISPAFAHVWVMVFEAASVTVAMYCLVQFYLQLKNDLAPYKPGIKIACIKLVIFLSFWQTLLVSFLTSAKTNLVKPSDSVSYADLTVGVPSILLCVEMALFAILHIFAFPYKGYHKANASAVSEFYEGSAPYQGGFLGVKAYMDAWNPWDLIKAVGRGFRWLFVGRKKRLEDESYKNHREGVGMEPRRDGAPYEPPQPANPRFSGGIIGGKPGRYQPLNEEEDQDLLHHAQSNPMTGAEPYVGPHPTLGPPLNQAETGDIGDAPSAPERWNDDQDHPGSFQMVPPAPGAVAGRPQHLPPAVAAEDTSYYGAVPSPAPIPGHGPGSGSGSGQGPQSANWDMWAGARTRRPDGPHEPPGNAL